jgi:hypothetical protein
VRDRLWDYLRDRSGWRDRLGRKWGLEVGIEWLVQRNTECKTKFQLLGSNKLEFYANCNFRLQLIEWGRNLMKTVINYHLEVGRGL